jgi:hypothetical protein
MPMKTSNVVLLLPGFFGFDRFATFYYFADRVSATLRGHLEAQTGSPFPVIPLATGPADGLAVRQRTFLDALKQIDRQLGGVSRIHLVGHSTGGLDADLLLAERPLDGARWSADDRALRDRIASVTTLAAPHYGTTLALADIARFAAQPFQNAVLVPSVVPVARALLSIAPDRAAKGAQLLGGAGSVYRFVRQMIYRRELLSDLAPDYVEDLRQQYPRELTHVPVTCFVTHPLRNQTREEGRFSEPDAFFLHLQALTADARVEQVSGPVRENIRRLNEHSAPVIASPSEPPRPAHVFDDTDNDAIVNTARQIAPGSRLGAVVYADHADVIGHYDRRDPLRPDQFIKEGVFRSGAYFRDDEFFELYRRIAAIVAAEARPAPQAVRAAKGARRVASRA